MDYREIISKMTLEEKASILSGKDFWQSMNIDRLGIKSMFLSDGPNGIRKQAVAADHLGLNESLKATCFPPSATVANSWNLELGEQIGVALGIEAAAEGVNVLLGPGINMKRNPRCGRNFEYFSEDPYLAGKMGGAYIRGIQQRGISACVKHFAANNQEERRMVIDTVVDERTLREIYLTGFEIAIKDGKPKCVMSSYNKVNGDYANENKHLMRDILRGEWAFDGVVVTDWGGCNDRVSGLLCGNELEMPSSSGETCRDVVKAVRCGELEESVLDECLLRLLKLVFETDSAINKTQKPDFAKHHELAQRAAEESIVLLKNRDNILPLNNSSKICIIGDFAEKIRFQGAGSSYVNPIKIDETAEFIGDYNLNIIGFERGFKRYGGKSEKLVKRACNLAKQSDIILLYIGLDEFTETEGLDRKDIKLPANQVELIARLKTLNKRIVAVLASGSVVEMNWADSVDAVLHTYLPGQAGAKAILNVLTGKVNPSGKLAESYPYSYAGCPTCMTFPGKEMSVEYREGLFIGYRYYDTAGIWARYPFGFGLSYTTFSYKNFKIGDDGVIFTVKNTGKVDGAEIAQMYIGVQGSSVFRAKKELKGFKKIWLKAGEEVAVFIPFDEYSFRFFNVCENKWQVESGTYSIFIGSSSADLRLSGELEVNGDAKQFAYSIDSLPSYFSGKIADVSKEEFERLIGRKVPEPSFRFIKKNRILVDYNTTVLQLRYAKGFMGRLFAFSIRFSHAFMLAFGKRRSANALAMGMFNNPMRNVSRMSGGIVSFGQLDGMILMFNGHFFKGLHKYLKEGRIKKRLRRADKKSTKH